MDFADVPEITTSGPFSTTALGSQTTVASPISSLYPGAFTFDEDDVRSLALCAWKEARGEGQRGMLAVMLTAKNRVGAPGFAHTIHEVIYGKNQFSSMSRPSDPQFNLEPPEDQLWATCKEEARRVLCGTEPDITHGARYYWNPKTSDENGWFAREIASNPAAHPETARIGRHTFYA